MMILTKPAVTKYRFCSHEEQRLLLSCMNTAAKAAEHLLFLGQQKQKQKTDTPMSKPDSTQYQNCLRGKDASGPQCSLLVNYFGLGLPLYSDSPDWAESVSQRVKLVHGVNEACSSVATAARAPAALQPQP